MQNVENPQLLCHNMQPETYTATQVFCHQFGYGLTVTADKWEPIDIGMQFVKSGHYPEAISFLDELVEKYQMKHPILFTAGQMSMMASAGL